MITRFLGRACALALVLSATWVAQDANAEMMVWIECNCQPDDQAQATYEISSQASDVASLGERLGWETGDTVVISNPSASPNQARWEYQPGGYWQNTSGEGYNCTTGFLGEFSACIDKTGNLPSPPWSPPPQGGPTIADVYCYLQNMCASTYGITFGTATGYPVHYFDVDLRHNDGSWLDYVNADYGYCNVDYAGPGTKVDVRLTLYTAFGTVQCGETLYTYDEC